MNKKTLTILLSTIAGVVILAVIVLLAFSKLSGKDSGKKKEDVSSVLSGQSEGEENPLTSDTGDSAEAGTDKTKTESGTPDKQTESGTQNGDTPVNGGAQSADGTQTASGAKTGSDAQSASETKTADDGQTASEAKTSDGTKTSSDKSGSASQATAKEVAITVNDVSAKVGQNIKVPVTITKNPGVMAMLLQFDYDADSLEYLNVENASLFGDCQSNPEKGTVKVILSADQDVKKDGDILYLHFKVKQNAKATSTIKISANKDSIANYDEQLLTLKTVNGTVTVK